MQQWCSHVSRALRLVHRLMPAVVLSRPVQLTPRGGASLVLPPAADVEAAAGPSAASRCRVGRTRWSKTASSSSRMRSSASASRRAFHAFELTLGTTSFVDRPGAFFGGAGGAGRLDGVGLGREADVGGGESDAPDGPACSVCRKIGCSGVFVVRAAGVTGLSVGLGGGGGLQWRTPSSSSSVSGTTSSASSAASREALDSLGGGARRTGGLDGALSSPDDESSSTSGGGRCTVADAVGR